VALAVPVGWLDLVRALGPECPARIDDNGTDLRVDRANAVLTQERRYRRLESAEKAKDSRGHHEAVRSPAPAKRLLSTAVCTFPLNG